jgi:Na+/proline symporter
VVLAYTVWGGMFSVAITDLFQSAVIVLGLGAIAWLVADMAGGAGRVVAAARDAGKFSFWPRGGTGEWLAFGAAFLTQSVGAIPQQDVYQRVTSARTERTAVHSCYLGAAAYCAFAFVPVFIAYAALIIEPSLGRIFAGDDAREIQAILPDLILERTPVWAQVLFFGALLSAILSTASGALLAPTALFTENVLRPLHRGLPEQRLLPALRIVLVCFTGCALAFSLTSTSTMYDMVQDAYKVTLVGALVPLAAGLYWKRANSAGAVLSMLLGIGSWAAMEAWGEASAWPPQLVGLAFALIGMIAGSHMPRMR